MLWRKLHLNWRYALGEFAIVVLGVLAAFWVENWNSDRQDRILEADYVAALIIDLRNDVDALKFAQQEAIKYAGRAHLLLDSLEEKAIDNPASDYVRAAITAGWLQFPEYTRITFEELTSTGNLRLIRDDNIRASLSTYYSRAENRDLANQSWKDYQITLNQLLPEYLPLRFREAGAPWASEPYIATDADARAILDAISENPKIKYAMENMVRSQSVLHAMHGRRMNEIEDLIAELKAYQ